MLLGIGRAISQLTGALLCDKVTHALIMPPPQPSPALGAREGELLTARCAKERSDSFTPSVTIPRSAQGRECCVRCDWRDAAVAVQLCATANADVQILLAPLTLPRFPQGRGYAVRGATLRLAQCEHQ